MRLAHRVMLAAASGGFVAMACAQDAASPVALIEDVRGPVQGAELFDYAYAGDRIDLTGGGVVVLSFFENCAVQTVDGGVATVSAVRANVTGGLTSTTERPCKGADLVVADAGEAAASVKRFDVFDVDFNEQAVVSLNPIFKWEADRPARVTIYFAEAPQERVIWSGQVARNVLPWPSDAPEIVVGMPYHVVAELAGGRKVEAVFSVDPGLDYPDVGANRLVRLDASPTEEGR